MPNMRMAFLESARRGGGGRGAIVFSAKKKPQAAFRCRRRVGKSASKLAALQPSTTLYSTALYTTPQPSTPREALTHVIHITHPVRRREKRGWNPSVTLTKQNAQGYPPTAIGYPPTAIGYPPTGRRPSFPSPREKNPNLDPDGRPLIHHPSP